MDVDWPFPKRRRLDVLPQDSFLWGCCDALALYAGHGAEAEEGNRSPSPSGEGGVSRLEVAAGVSAPEPLLRALTQLANAAASDTTARRQMVLDCEVQVPLLRLMQSSWACQSLVIERCCRLLHWLCSRTPANREVVVAHRGPAIGGAHSVSYVHCLLSLMEFHHCREVLSHALRALAALMPCASARGELLQTQSRMLACLAVKGETLDASAIASVCRWFPGLSRQLRTFSEANRPQPFTGMVHSSSNSDVEMSDTTMDDVL